MLHIWEQSGIGKAPFVVVDVFEIPSRALLEQNPTAYNNAMADAPCAVGGCRVCGTGLTINYIIRDAFGVLFAVGCECVKKSGDKGLIKATNSFKNQRQREINHIKRMDVINTKLEQQRQANNGLTDYELAVKQRLEADQKHADIMAPVVALLSPLADRLADGKGGFCDSVSADLKKGIIPKGRGESIMLDVLAKQAGRVNSAAYKAELDALCDILDQAENLLKTIN